MAKKKKKIVVKKKPRTKKPTKRKKRVRKTKQNKGTGIFGNHFPTNRTVDSNQYWQLRAEMAGAEGRVLANLKDRQADYDRKEANIEKIKAEVKDFTSLSPAQQKWQQDRIRTPTVNAGPGVHPGPPQRRYSNPASSPRPKRGPPPLPPPPSNTPPQRHRPRAFGYDATSRDDAGVSSERKTAARRDLMRASSSGDSPATRALAAQQQRDQAATPRTPRQNKQMLSPQVRSMVNREVGDEE